MTCPRCEELDRQLRDMRGDGIHVPAEWGLTPTEGKLLRALIANGRMSRGGLMTAIYGAEEGPFDHIITQMVSRIRRKLRGVGPTIATVSGYGYDLHDHKDWRRKLEEGRVG